VVTSVADFSRGRIGRFPFFPVSDPSHESFRSMSTVLHRSLVAIKTGPELPELESINAINGE
jgi:hypothetical protein